MSSSVFPMIGLWWLSTVDPTVAPGVSAPLDQMLYRTDNNSLYRKSGNADTAWTLVGSGGGSSGTGPQAFMYGPATGAEANPMTVNLPVARGNALYVAMAMFKVNGGSVLPQRVFNLLVGSFDIEFSAALTAGDVVMFYVTDLT